MTIFNYQPGDGGVFATISMGACFTASLIGGFDSSDDYTRKDREEDCPFYARSCAPKKYDRCCVPEHGLMTLSQVWIPESISRDFSMHGFWPGACFDNRDLSMGCDSDGSKHRYNVRGDIPSNSNLYQEMKKNWEPLTKQVNKDGTAEMEELWTEEWNKRGTCLSTVEDTCPEHQKLPAKNQVERYFRLSMSMYYKYNIREILASAADPIVPGGHYTKQQFKKALDGTRVGYSLHCRAQPVDLPPQRAIQVYTGQSGHDEAHYKQLQVFNPVMDLLEVRLYLVGAANNNFIPNEASAASKGNCSNMINFPKKHNTRYLAIEHIKAEL